MKKMVLALVLAVGVTPLAPNEVVAQSSGRTILCPDGTYVVGDRCHMAPDGTYHGNKPQMAPDGTYTGGKPVMTPNGNYIGGNGPRRLCPDGSYVRGARCKLLPNGSYIGSD